MHACGSNSQPFSASLSPSWNTLDTPCPFYILSRFVTVHCEIIFCNFSLECRFLLLQICLKALYFWHRNTLLRIWSWKFLPYVEKRNIYSGICFSHGSHLDTTDQEDFCELFTIIFSLYFHFSDYPLWPSLPCTAETYQTLQKWTGILCKSCMSVKYSRKGSGK